MGPRALSVVISALALVGIASAQTPAPPAPSEMSRAELEAELATARPMLQNGAVRPNRPQGCTGAEYRQFDFWLGEWDVSPSIAHPVVVAESTITALAQGCIVMENWRPFAGAHGYSLNVFDRSDRLWHQMYVGAAGRRTTYSGQIEGAVLTLDMLNAPPPNSAPDFRQRMRYQQIDANTVRQWGETLANGEWTVSFDFTYRRRPGTG